MNKQLPKEIVKLRQENASAREEIEWITSSSLPHEELKARISGHINSMFQENDIARHLLSLANPAAGSAEAKELFRLRTRIYIGAQSAGTQEGGGVFIYPTTTDANIDGVGQILAWLAKDALYARLVEEIDRLDYRPGPPLADRPKLVAAQRKLLAELEHREEVLIVAAEDAGHIIPRRPDADPAVVLGYDPDGQMAEDRTRVGKSFIGVLTE